MYARCFHVLVVSLLLLPVVIECCLRAPVDKEKQCSYSMEVATGDNYWAGTDNDVLAQLSNGIYYSKWINLDNDDKDDLERNQVDTFTFDEKCFRYKPCVEMKNNGFGAWTSTNHTYRTCRSYRTDHFCCTYRTYHTYRTYRTYRTDHSCRTDYSCCTYRTYRSYRTYHTYRSYRTDHSCRTYRTYRSYRTYRTYRTDHFCRTYHTYRTYRSYRTYRTYHTYRTYRSYRTDHSCRTYRTYRSYHTCYYYCAYCNYCIYHTTRPLSGQPCQQAFAIEMCIVHPSHTSLPRWKSTRLICPLDFM
ncbi:hypothetical protein LSAT2_002076 [Lamellibrachia satsuma]|nr:hypothetical protein LSAT2_002076 [Lamellibrachia satsuma]